MWLILEVWLYMHVHTTCIHTNSHHSHSHPHSHHLILIGCWHRKVIKKWNEASYVPLGRPGFEPDSLRHPLSSKLNDCSRTYSATVDQAKNSTAHSYDEWGFTLLMSLLELDHSGDKHIFVYKCALAQGSDFKSKEDRLSSSGQIRMYISRVSCQKGPICHA